MILARLPLFRHPDRQPELIISVVVLCWGLSAFIDSFLTVARHAMAGPFFQPLLATGIDQRGWGVFAIVVGIVRLACLWINGSRPKGSTVFRAIGAGCSGVLWLGFLLGALQLPWMTGALFTYGGFLAFDLLSVLRASREIAAAFKRGTPANGIG
ncbi:hypothetical protein FPZ24_08095 [Sphingomonas panacisoli]|uniref:Uncharacterized protein n=1 Tax=Sphingomonas panacisoli TaxID=1813879 RepID=A0A5B8LIL2_9SPHN|nr:hypothetical protein [Sphingomonas panacisoli]QDZ07444.1 hypothetical protein FPZ24_08095 [Sphingomonas panacisoli]